jgi:hypothetical protein
VRLLRGAPFLTAAGSPYLFHCPLHPGMTSKLIVTSAGAPLPADTTPPGAGVKLKTGNVGKLVRKRRLRLLLGPSEPVDAVIKASAGGARLGRVERTYVTAGRKALTIRLSPKAAGTVAAAGGRGPVQLRVKISLTDVAGNRKRVRAIRTLAAGGGAGKGAARAVRPGQPS